MAYAEGLTNIGRYDRIVDMRKSLTIVTFVLVLSMANPSFAFWIWTPKDKKWTNPKWSAKISPEEQYKFSKEVFDSGDYKRALVEFKKVLSHFPESFQAAEAQFYIGECLEKMGKLYNAYLAYQKVIDKYPFSEKMNDVLERELKIADAIAEEEMKVLGLSIPQYHHAITIYRRIIENYPYGEIAPISQYKIGLVLKSAGSFDEAKAEFEKVISSYPDSEWVEPAKFQIAQTASIASLDADYDQELSKEAKDRYEEFLQKHPDAELSEEAQEEILSLTDKEAEKDYNIGQFYENQKAFEGAVLYYEDVIKKYPRSTWAQKSLERIQVLEEERKI
ncbi:outer membrane protein assembly factor BamD [Candidatus Omnitrophota bacterium]